MVVGAYTYLYQPSSIHHEDAFPPPTKTQYETIRSSKISSNKPLAKLGLGLCAVAVVGCMVLGSSNLLGDSAPTSIEGMNTLSMPATGATTVMSSSKRINKQLRRRNAKPRYAYSTQVRAQEDRVGGYINGKWVDEDGGRPSRSNSHTGTSWGAEPAAPQQQGIYFVEKPLSISFFFFMDYTYKTQLRGRLLLHGLSTVKAIEAGATSTGSG